MAHLFLTTEKFYNFIVSFTKLHFYMVTIFVNFIFFSDINMSKKIYAFFISQIILHLAFGGIPLLVVQASENKPPHKDFIQKAEQLRLLFITNAGQTHEKVMYHADTFVGKVFITKDGEIVYSLLSKSKKKELQVLGQESVTWEAAFGRRVLDDGMLLRAKIPDTSLISCRRCPVIPTIMR